MNELSAIIDGLEKSPEVLAGLIRSIPEDRLRVRRKEGLWTVFHHACHLAEVQTVLHDRLVRFRDEARPEIVPYFPGDGRGRARTYAAIDEALDDHGHWRRKQLALIRNFSESDWRKEGSHQEYSDYNLTILVRHIVMHDYWHMYRIEELWLTRDEYLENL